jgi:hypothetical protein
MRACLDFAAFSQSSIRRFEQKETTRNRTEALSDEPAPDARLATNEAPGRPAKAFPKCSLPVIPRGVHRDAPKGGSKDVNGVLAQLTGRRNCDSLRSAVTDAVAQEARRSILPFQSVPNARRCSPLRLKIYNWNERQAGFQLWIVPKRDSIVVLFRISHRLFVVAPGRSCCKQLQRWSCGVKSHRLQPESLSLCLSGFAIAKGAQTEVCATQKPRYAIARFDASN